MNSRQRSVVSIAAAAIALMLLYPPFRFVARNGVEYNLGYSWIFAPPPISSSNATLGSVNLWLLLAQWAAVILIAGALLFVLKDSTSKGNSDPLPPSDKSAPSSRPREPLTAPMQFTVTALRVIRGVVGFVAALQVMQLFVVVSWTQNPGAITGNMVAVALLKVVALIVLAAAFFGLRWLLNYLCIRGTGLPHPALARRWAL